MDLLLVSMSLVSFNCFWDGGNDKRVPTILYLEEGCFLVTSESFLLFGHHHHYQYSIHGINNCLLN